jgi:hypothetical protein
LQIVVPVLAPTNGTRRVNLITKPVNKQRNSVSEIQTKFGKHRLKVMKQINTLKCQSATGSV